MPNRSLNIECVVDARAEVAESPVWSVDEQVLYWADIYGGGRGGRLNRYDPASGANTHWQFDAPLGSFGLRTAGGMVLALQSGFHRFDPAANALARIAQPEPERPNNRLNDGRCDRAGRFWCGSMRDPADPAQPTGTLHRLDPDGTSTPMLDGLFVTNGLAFGPDDRTLYVSDSIASVRTIWAFDFDLGAGTIANRRVFVDTHGMDGRPDGAAVDADGCYWMAANDGWALARFTPRGRLDRTIRVPVAKPAMLAFGGRDLRTIFVTSIRPKGRDLADQPQAGGVFAVEGAGIQGLPEPMFGG
ncbi:MAG: SMP-30/gluconolactonase/LRE family protein [Burkholderiales bacterium]|nr:SMP-30/gluconolactonase/LRE family protein [Burkholderiales bacterium]